SHSGESDEIVRMLSVIKKLGNPVIAMTATAVNSLGRFSDVVLKLGKIEEACPLGLAPSASTTAMMALGDALFLSVMKSRSFSAEQFALYHPAGQLGRKLIRVKEAMAFRIGENLPVASDQHTVGQVLKRPVREVMTANPKRISGDALASEAMAIMRQHRIDELPVIDEHSRPIGLIDIQDLVVLRMFDVDGEGKGL